MIFSDSESDSNLISIALSYSQEPPALSAATKRMNKRRDAITENM